MELQFDNQTPDTAKPITVLGRTFATDEERRTYFREELRKQLPELKQIEGFPIGEDENILKLSDPPYYTACPNPWINDFIAEWETEKVELEAQGKRVANFEVDEPYASDVSEGKYNDIYFKHPYHTKVPIAAISEYLEHYVQCGDIIFDGFAGTGMTGVAAQLKNKRVKSITLDLSPIASFINYDYNYPLDKEMAIKHFSEIMEWIKTKHLWMFKTNHVKNEFGIINSVVWSDVFICNSCGNDIVFWECGVDQEKGKILPSVSCDKCQASFAKSDLKRKTHTIFDNDLNESVIVSSLKPVHISYNYKNKTYYKVPDDSDFVLLSEIENSKINTWFPRDLIQKGEKTSDVLKVGINYVHQIYFKRDLWILSEFYNQVKLLPLLGVLTAVAFRITKRYALTYMSGKWGAGGGPTNGTYYIPSLIKELNVIDMLENAFKKYINASFEQTKMNVISTQSATELKLKSQSIDYIFTDPPFGNNFIYSEINFIWEAWLKVFTNNLSEAIESRTYNKTIFIYKDLMTKSFQEFYRILKPGKWMSVEFSNTKASIWNMIQQSIQDAGFIVANISALDKQKGSFNAQVTVTAVKQDLIISCYKPSSEFDTKFQQSQHSEVGIWDFVTEHLNHLKVHLVKENATTAVIERSPKIIFDRLIAFYVQRNLPVPIDAPLFQKGLKERFIERDGMFFTSEKAHEYDSKKAELPNFVQLSLLVASEQDGVMWLRRELEHTAQTYQELQPKWMQALAGVRKGDILPELKDILEENFLQNESGAWYLPDLENEIDLEKVRTGRMLRLFATYREQASKPKGKIKEARVEALRVGFKQCYKDKDFKTIVTIGDSIPNNLLMEDEVLLQYYDIAISRV
jgi:DNA modification methylase